MKLLIAEMKPGDSATEFQAVSRKVTFTIHPNQDYDEVLTHALGILHTQTSESKKKPNNASLHYALTKYLDIENTPRKILVIQLDPANSLWIQDATTKEERVKGEKKAEKRKSNRLKEEQDEQNIEDDPRANKQQKLNSKVSFEWENH